MRRFLRFLFRAAVGGLLAALVLVLAWAARPDLPGRYLVARLKQALPFPFEAADARIWPDGTARIAAFKAGAGHRAFACGQALARVALSTLFVGVPEMRFEFENVSLSDSAWRDGIGPWAVDLRSVAGRANGGERPRLDLTVGLAGGTLRFDTAGDPGFRTGFATLGGGGLDLRRIFERAPYLPVRTLATVDEIAGRLDRTDGIPTGEIRFGTGAGTFMTVETTSPIHLYPTGFGEVPTSLGLSPERSSVFDRLSGEARLLADGSARFGLDIASPHYRLEARGTLSPDHRVDGALVLALPPATLAGNAIGLDFKALGDEPLNIYGRFSGPVEAVESAWDIDKAKLLRGATDAARNRVRDAWQGLWKK